MMGFMPWLIFHKNSVTNCKEIKKDCEKKACDD